MKHSLPVFLYLLFPFLSIAQANSLSCYHTVKDFQRKASVPFLTGNFQKELNKIDWQNAERTSGTDTPLYIIPVIFHVLHDYGSELVSEDSLYTSLDRINAHFLKTNADTALVISRFKKLIGNPRILFKAARKDPNGKPTRGIDHIYTYNTYYAADQSKLNQWPPSKYLNIWVANAVNDFSGGLNSGYGNPPVEAATSPYYDGIIISSNYLGYLAYEDHHIGTYLGLNNPCGTFMCADADSIEDTPPCSDPGNCAVLTDTTCTDTANVQNIMNSKSTASCAIMFTKGQAKYMDSILTTNLGKRDSLVSPYNRAATGIDLPLPDMAPVADFFIQNTSAPNTTNTLVANYYMCLGQTFRFTSKSWNDTDINLSWQFTNKASIATSAASSIDNSFYKPGWVSVTLVANSNAGTDTLIRQLCVYAADTAALNPIGYYQEFLPSKDVSTWPRFNYYNTYFKWQLTSDYGYFDKYSMVYTGYDIRSYPGNVTGPANGGFSDFYSPAFNLSGLPIANLNFLYAGAYRTDNSKYMTDTLEIDYSNDCGSNWQLLTAMGGVELGNNGKVDIAYAPQLPGEWKLKSIDLPAVVKGNKTLFRFRYRPGGPDNNGQPVNNNFYIDRVNISNWPAGLNTLMPSDKNIALVPNPTNGNAYVIAGGNGNNIHISVSDITGKIVYRAAQGMNGKDHIEIPASFISAKGIYLVQIVTDGQIKTEKLVVY